MNIFSTISLNIPKFIFYYLYFNKYSMSDLFHYSTLTYEMIQSLYVHIVHSGRDLFDLFSWIDCRLMNIVRCIWWIAQIFQEDREEYSIPKRKSRKMLTRCFARKTGVTSKKILAAHLLSVLPATYCTSQCNLTSVYQILSPKFFQKKPLLAFSKKILPFNTQSFEEKLVINRIFSFD